MGSYARYFAQSGPSGYDNIAVISLTRHSVAMADILSPLRKLLRRWSRQREGALRQMTERKTAGQRIAGYSKSERVDAKFWLLAMAPFSLVMLSDQLGWSRGFLWEAWFWLSVLWAICLFGIGSAAYWKALREAMRRNE